MLSYMREKSGSWIIKVLFGIIVVVFVFFFGFSDIRNSDKDTTVAKVGFFLEQHAEVYAQIEDPFLMPEEIRPLLP